MMQQARHLFRRKFVQDTLILQVSKFGVIALGMVSWIIVPVRLGPEGYGLFALAQSLLGIWQALNLTGLNTSTSVLLATAVGAKDEGEILNLMSVYVKILMVWAAFSFVVLMLIGPPLASLLYPVTVPPDTSLASDYPLLAGIDSVGNTRVGTLAAFLALILFFDPIYSLIVIAFRSRRSMAVVGGLQNINQLILTISLVTAALLSPTPEGQVVARIVYSFVTMVVALVLYRRLRTHHPVVYPTFGAILRNTRTVSYRPYWRFGVANALDKNISGLYTQIPLQLVGIFGGPVAASYIQLGLRAMNKVDLLSAAVLENMQAVVPQAVGQGKYRQLWQNFLRVLGVLALGGVVIYGAFVLLAPLLVVPIFGDEWLPILPLLPVFAIYGITTTIGGVFGPLYRAFDLMRAELVIKVVTLLVMVPAGIWLVSQSAAVGGVWMINGMFVMSVALTAILMLNVLYRHVQHENIE